MDGARHWRVVVPDLRALLAVPAISIAPQRQVIDSFVKAGRR